MGCQRVSPLFALTLLVAGPVVGLPAAQAQAAGPLQWIWFDEGNPNREAPAATRYFRKVFVGRPHGSAGPKVLEGKLDVTADDEFSVWLNGKEVGKGGDPGKVFSFDVKGLIVMGPNVLAVKARNKGGPAGLLVRLGYVTSNSARVLIQSDGTWKAAA